MLLKRIFIWFALAMIPIWLVGCATEPATGLGEEAGSTELPTGLTLLDSDGTECAGAVQLGFGVRADDEELVVAPGQNAAFEVEESEIEWACLDRALPARATMECPLATTHLRVTRGEAGREVLFECFGRG